jgi:hypothetical protein
MPWPSPLRAFPSWFLRIECDRCGKVRWLNEAHVSEAQRRLLPDRGARLGTIRRTGRLLTPSEPVSNSARAARPPQPSWRARASRSRSKAGGAVAAQEPGHVAWLRSLRRSVQGARRGGVPVTQPPPVIAPKRLFASGRLPHWRAVSEAHAPTRVPSAGLLICLDPKP